MDSLSLADRAAITRVSNTRPGAHNARSRAQAGNEPAGARHLHRLRRDGSTDRGVPGGGGRRVVAGLAHMPRDITERVTRTAPRARGSSAGTGRSGVEHVAAALQGVPA